MSWALVTGGAARGGAAICRALHDAGRDIIVHHSSRSVAAARSLAAQLEGQRPNSTALWESEFAADVDVPKWLLSLAPDVCVCNASVYRPSQLADQQRCRADWAVHVGAHAALLEALRPGLRSVVAVSDIHVDRPAKGYVWYTVAKAGLQALALALAVEWAPDVRCNVVAPGALRFPDDWTDAERAQAVERSVPLGRLGTFEELASAVRWLALDASYVTGHVLALDGGRSRALS